MSDTVPPRLRRVFIRGLELQARLGVHAHEKVGPQRIVVHVVLDVRDDGPEIGPDALARVVDYEQVVLAARQAVSGGHVLLVETLAENLAALALRDHRVFAHRFPSRSRTPSRTWPRWASRWSAAAPAEPGRASPGLGVGTTFACGCPPRREAPAGAESSPLSRRCGISSTGPAPPLRGVQSSTLV